MQLIQFLCHLCFRSSISLTSLTSLNLRKVRNPRLEASGPGSVLTTFQNANQTYMGPCLPLLHSMDWLRLARRSSPAKISPWCSITMHKNDYTQQANAVGLGTQPMDIHPIIQGDWLFFSLNWQTNLSYLSADLTTT